MTNSIEKQLTGNDTGETGSHQAGMLIPKEGGILGFFPRLGSTVKNPRSVIDVVDDAGKLWSFSFIYYNGRFFGGTRNEYRLTGMTGFIKQFNLKTGDIISLNRESDRLIRIRYRREHERTTGKVLKLGLSGWRILDCSSED